MSSPSTILTNVREADARFAGMLTKRMANPQAPYSGLVARIPAPAGYHKISDVYAIGEMEDAKGTATVNGLSSAAQIIFTKGRRYVGGIDHELMMTADSEFAGRVSTAIMQSADVVACDIEKRLTTLLEANGNDFLGSAFFATNGTIPDTSITIDNLISSGTTLATASEVRASVFSALEKFDGMRNSMNCPMHGGPESGARFVLMVPPALRQVAFDALLPSADGVISNDQIRLSQLGVVPRVNTFLTSGAAAYLFAVDAIYQPLRLAERGSPVFRQTSQQNDYNLIMENEHLWGPYYAAEVGFGARISAVKIVDTSL